MELFREEGRWAFIPGADLLLTVGEGFLGLTALGVVLSQWAEPVAPQSIHYLETCKGFCMLFVPFHGFP